MAESMAKLKARNERQCAERRALVREVWRKVATREPEPDAPDKQWKQYEHEMSELFFVGFDIADRAKAAEGRAHAQLAERAAREEA